MRKLIDIPDDQIKDLIKLAKKNNRNVKNYIENLILETIKKSKL